MAGLRTRYEKVRHMFFTETNDGSLDHFAESGPLTTKPELGVQDDGHEVPAAVVYALWCYYVRLNQLGLQGLRTKTGDLGVVRRRNIAGRTHKGVQRACLVWMAIGKLPVSDTCYNVKRNPTWYWKKEHPLLLPLQRTREWPEMDWLKKEIGSTGMQQEEQHQEAEEDVKGEGKARGSVEADDSEEDVEVESGADEAVEVGDGEEDMEVGGEATESVEADDGEEHVEVEGEADEAVEVSDSEEDMENESEDESEASAESVPLGVSEWVTALETEVRTAVRPTYYIIYSVNREYLIASCMQAWV